LRVALYLQRDCEAFSCPFHKAFGLKLLLICSQAAS
jgi:hypothetical protein